jgi:hypothetical protein
MYVRVQGENLDAVRNYGDNELREIFKHSTTYEEGLAAKCPDLLPPSKRSSANHQQLCRYSLLRLTPTNTSKWFAGTECVESPCTCKNTAPHCGQDEKCDSDHPSA